MRFADGGFDGAPPPVRWAADVHYDEAHAELAQATVGRTHLRVLTARRAWALLSFAALTGGLGGCGGGAHNASSVTTTADQRAPATSITSAVTHSSAPTPTARADHIVSISGVNMAPTLLPNDQVGVYIAGDRLRRGDIVLLHPPGDADPEKVVVQRIIALPGEKIETRNRKVFVNDRALEEPYLGNDIVTDPTFTPITLGSDSYWVMGDNRGNSRDSRFFGPVRQAAIVGVIRSIVAPAPRARSL